MIYNKITEEEFQDLINEFKEMGNPEIESIINQININIKEFRKFLFFNYYISDWYLHRNYGHNNSKYSGKSWNFSKFISLQREEFHNIDSFYKQPEIVCILLDFDIYISNFIGSNLDIPNDGKIRFELSGWSIYLIKPTFEEEVKNERLKYKSSLNNIENIFKISNSTKAYINTEFEYYDGYYHYLDKLE